MKLQHNVLCDRQQVVPIHTLVLPDLIIGANTARVDHNAALWICLGVEEVVALGAEVEGGLVNVECECVCRSMNHEDAKEVRCISE